MSTNSSKMSLEERLVQHIKTTGLNVLVDDEDAITELTRRAIQQALFAPRGTTTSWNGGREVQTLVVEAAKEIAQAALKKVMQEEVDALLAKPETRKTLRDAMLLSMLTETRNYGRMIYDNLLSDAAQQATDMIRNIT